MLLAIPAVMAFFWLYRWKTKDCSVFIRVSKVALILGTSVLMLFAFFMLQIGVQEFIDLYL